MAANAHPLPDVPLAPPASFPDILSEAGVRRALLPLLTPAFVYRLQRTNKSIMNNVKAFHSEAYDINSFLDRYFYADNLTTRQMCREFRSLQAKTGALLAGPCVLQFLDGLGYDKDTRLDIVVAREGR